LCKKKWWIPDPTFFHGRGNKRCHLIGTRKRKKKKEKKDEEVENVNVHTQSQNQESYMSDSLKRGVIITLHKGGRKRKDDPNNYRAITLTSVILKLYEMLLLHRCKSNMYNDFLYVA